MQQHAFSNVYIILFFIKDKHLPMIYIANVILTPEEI